MSGTTLVDRSLLRLSGADVRSFLQGLVTQDVHAVAPDQPQWSGLLSPQGKALFDFLLWADGEDLLVDCEAAETEALAKRLALYRLRRAITIMPEPALAVHWAKAGDAGVPDPRLAALGRRWLAPAGAPAEGWLAHRLAQGVTEGVAELGRDRLLWLECNAAELNGVSFTKGCYVGQENTARMNWRQKVNRRLVVVEAAADPGDAAQAWYPQLGLAVARVRVEALAAPLPFGVPLLPGWLQAAIA